jgi:small ligand-binding sensory domain FIST
MINAVATGLSHGHQARPEHAARAVREALMRCELTHASGVLLFLTHEYANDPEPALRAAAREARCLQVIGATGAGILTEREWVLDSPGAAAMVFGEPYRLDLPADDLPDDAVVLSLCTPSGMAAEWLDQDVRRFGAVSADLFGHGPFKVWSAARVAEGGRAEAVIAGARGAVVASQGVHALTAPIEVAEARGYDLIKLGNYPALSVLVQSLPPAVRESGRIPLHLLMGGVTFGDPLTAIREGRYRLNHILGADPGEQSITLSQPLHAGERLFWAMRDALAAERDMRRAMESARGELAADPDFALLFPCLGRGPHFFGNRDRDLEQLRARFPKTPILGMYGNGEIGPLDGINHLFQYSAILGLFRAGGA